MTDKPETVIALLNQSGSWVSPKLLNRLQISLSKALGTTVRSIDSSLNFCVFHLDLEKIADSVFDESLLFLINIESEISPKDLDTLLGQIENITTTHLKYGQPSLLFLFNGAINLLSYFEDSFPNSYIGSDNDFKKLIGIRTEARNNLCAMFLEQCMDVAKCPFQYLGPVKPDMFVGRADLIKEILGWNQKAYAIPGGRRIGKSSLLLKLKAEAEKIVTEDGKNKYEILYIDCSNFFSFQNLIGDIIRRLSPKSYFDFIKKHHSYFDFNKILERYSGMNPKTLLLLLDEMDPLIKNSKKHDEDSLSFYNTIRNHANENQLRLVISGFTQVYEMVQNSAHPFYNLCISKYLGFLEVRDIRRLIVRPLVTFKSQPQKQLHHP